MQHVTPARVEPLNNDIPKDARQTRGDARIPASATLHSAARIRNAHRATRRSMLPNTLLVLGCRTYREEGQRCPHVLPVW